MERDTSLPALIQRIRTLEQTARRLEPDAQRRRHMTDAVRGYAEGFLEALEGMPAFRNDHDAGRGLYASPISDEAAPIEDLLDLVHGSVDRPNLNPASGGHLGYIPGGGIYPAALGDYLAAVTNRFSGVYFASPGAVRMEHMLVRWMADLVGYPSGSAGDLTSGGSIANLVGVVTARDAHNLCGADVERAVVYTTDHVHHAVDKALRVAGMAGCVVRRVPLDDRYRMRPDALERIIEKDQSAGLHPWLVVGSAGTAFTGAVDPMNDLADIAAQHGLWYHVDGAYGGFFLLCEAGRAVMAGIERSDSIVMDPHKGLFLPYGTGAVLVRDRTHLQQAHAYQACYMQDADEAADEYSPADHSPELSRHFRGMRLWLPLKLFGITPFRDCLEEKLHLARYFHARIGAIDGFETGPAPDLSVVTYRYRPRRGDVDEFNRELVSRVQHDGRVFISSMMLDGRFTLRLAVLNFRTHLDTVDTAIDVLVHAARTLEGRSSR